MKTVLVVVLAGILSSISIAQTRTYVSAGIGMTNYTFQASDKNDVVQASLQNKNALSPTFGFHTTPRPFWASVPWLGGALGFSISNFKADRQVEGRFLNSDGTKPEDGLDLGTGVKGFVGYLAPALLLMSKFSETSFIYGGVGLGLGYASISGNYYQTSNGVSSACANATTGAEVQTNCPLSEARYSYFSFAPVVMGGISIGWFGIRAEGGGPVIHVDDKKFSTMNTAVSIQYQYFLQ